MNTTTTNDDNNMNYFPSRMNPLFMKRLDDILVEMKRRCAVQDAAYWDLSRVFPEDVLTDPHLLSSSWGGVQQAYSPNRIHLELADGYEILILFHCEGYGETVPGPWIPTHFNGYIKIPSSAPFLRDMVREGYDVFCDKVPTTPTMTFYDVHGMVGWNHGSGDDADLSFPEPGVRVSGPVQVLEEAMTVIQCFRRYETWRQQEVKAQQISLLEEELMRETWRPWRVRRWLYCGVEL